MEMANKDNLPKRCFVTDIAAILLMYSRYHLPQSQIYITCHGIIDFMDKVTSPESIESYMARVDSWQSSLVQHKNHRKRKASTHHSYPFQPFIMYLQVLLTIPSPSKALSLLHSLRNYENICVNDHQKAWFCLFDYYHQNDLLLVSHPHEDSKHLPFQNEMVSTTVGHFFLDYLYSLMSTLTEEVEQVLQRDNRSLSYEEENWLKYNQIRIRNTVLLYSSLRPALGKPLQLAALVAPSLDGSDVMQMNSSISSMSDEGKIWMLLKESYNIVERPSSLDSNLRLDYDKEPKDIETNEPKNAEVMEPLHMDSEGISDDIVSEKQASDEESQEVVVLHESDDDYSVHSDLHGEDLDIVHGEEHVNDADLYVSGSESQEDDDYEDDIDNDDEVIEEGTFEDNIFEEEEEEEEEEKEEEHEEYEEDEEEQEEYVEEHEEEEVNPVHEVQVDDDSYSDEKGGANAPGMMINAEELGISSDDYVASQDDGQYSDADDVSQTDSDNSFGEWQEDYIDDEDEENSPESEAPSDNLALVAKEDVLGDRDDSFGREAIAQERAFGSSSGSTQEKDFHSGFSLDDHTFTSGTNSERLHTRDKSHDSGQSLDDMADADDTTVEYSISAAAPQNIKIIDDGYDAEASGNDVTESDYTRNDESTPAEQSASKTLEVVDQTKLFSPQDIDEGNDADIEITENEDDGNKQDDSSITGVEIETVIPERALNIDDASNDEVGTEILNEHTNPKKHSQDTDIRNPNGDEKRIRKEQNMGAIDISTDTQKEKKEEQNFDDELQQVDQASVGMSIELQADDHDKTTLSSDKDEQSEIEDDYSAMSYRELQAECKSRGLSATGKKEDLRLRLHKTDGTSLAEVAETADEEVEEDDSGHDEKEEKVDFELQQEDQANVGMSIELQVDDHNESKLGEIEDDYSTMSYRELQAECKSRGLSATGKTDELLSRLGGGKIQLSTVKEETVFDHRKSFEREMEQIIQAAKESAKEEDVVKSEPTKTKVSPALNLPKGSRLSALIAKGIDLLTPKSKPNEVIEIDDSSVDDKDEVPSTPSLPNFVSVKEVPESAVSKMSDFSFDPSRSRKRAKSEDKKKHKHMLDTSIMPAEKKAKSSSSEVYKTRSSRAKKRISKK